MIDIYIGFEKVRVTYDGESRSVDNDPSTVAITIQVTDPNTNLHEDMPLENLIKRAGLK